MDVKTRYKVRRVVSRGTPSYQLGHYEMTGKPGSRRSRFKVLVHLGEHATPEAALAAWREDVGLPRHGSKDPPRLAQVARTSCEVGSHPPQPRPFGQGSYARAEGDAPAVGGRGEEAARSDWVDAIPGARIPSRERASTHADISAQPLRKRTTGEAIEATQLKTNNAVPNPAAISRKLPTAPPTARGFAMEAWLVVSDANASPRALIAPLMTAVHARGRHRT
jgi:hypothetical protein